MPSLRSSPRIRSVPQSRFSLAMSRSVPECLRSIETGPAAGLSASASRAASLGGASGARFRAGSGRDRASSRGRGAERPGYPVGYTKSITKLKTRGNSRREVHRRGTPGLSSRIAGRSGWGAGCGVAQAFTEDRRSCRIEFCPPTGGRVQGGQACTRRSGSSPWDARGVWGRGHGDHPAESSQPVNFGPK